MSNKPALRDHRLGIMEGVLAWEGEIGNARVRQLFDIQPVQASRLLAEFRFLMGDRIVEDSRAKVWRSASPEGIETDISLSEYARQTATDDGASSCIVDAGIDLTEVKPVVFALLRKAALKRAGIVISYASMENPTFEEWTIFPHSIIHVGSRWHVRAWCAKRKDFRDFMLGRIRSTAVVSEITTKGMDDDHGWNKLVQMRLAPHRRLSADQQKVVRSEYFGGTMGRRLSVRACLVPYVIQDLRLAIDPEKEGPPDFQIEITNAEQLRKALL